MDIKFKSKEGIIVNISDEVFKYKLEDGTVDSILIRDISKITFENYTTLSLYVDDEIVFSCLSDFQSLNKINKFVKMFPEKDKTVDKSPPKKVTSSNNNSAYKNESAVLKRFKEVGVTDTFGTNKEIQELPKLLHEGEIILYATSGLLDGNTWLIVCTDKRLLFLDKGMIFGIKTLEFRLDKINSVSAYKGMIFGELKISHGSATMTVKNVEKATVQKMVDVIHKAIDDYGNPTTPTQNQQAAQLDPYEEVKKLKELLDMGIISDKEFELKKNELLGL